MTDRYAGRGRRDEPPSEERAQSEVIGMVMLIGLVAIAAIALMLVAGQAVSDTEADAEKDRIEQSFVQLSHAMASATENGEMSQEIEFEAGDSGAVTKSDAGTINITGGDVNETLTMGAIEYEHEDGSIIAYQAGGVWAEQGQETRMVSAPPVTYDAADETLTLPMTTMGEEKDLSSGPVTVSLNSTDPVREASIVEDDTVTMEIQSPYYRGWAEYFQKEGGDGTVRDIDDENQSIRVEFGPLEFEDALENGATYSGEITENQSGEIEDEASPGQMRPMDDVIAEMVADVEDGSMETDREFDTIDNDTSLSNGTYYADEIDQGTLDVDLSEGNVTVIVDGDIVSPGEGKFIHVSNHTQGNELKIYTTGHFDNQNGGDVCVDPCDENEDASAIQLYGTSEMTVSIATGNPRYEGIIYAASDQDSWTYEDRQGSCDPEDYQVAFQSNVKFYGSLIADSICGQSKAYDFDHDSSLADADIDPYPDGYSAPPQITYLNIAIYELNVENR